MASARTLDRDPMSKLPLTHHRPHVHKSKGSFGKWWSACSCGHLKFYGSWHRALIDAMIHSETLR